MGRKDYKSGEEFQIGTKRFQIGAEITNRGKRDFKSGQGLQIDAEQKAILHSMDTSHKLMWINRMLCFSLSVICCLFLDELVANVQARCKAFINPHNVSSQILSTNSKTTIFGQQHPNFVYYADITYQSNFLNIRLYLIESIFIRILNGWNDYTISSIESLLFLWSAL